MRRPISRNVYTDYLRSSTRSTLATEFPQYFAGSPLDRSYVEKKDEYFLSNCLSNPSSRFVLTNSGKLLCHNLPPSSTDKVSLAFVDSKFILSLLQVNDIPTLSTDYLAVVLGCTYNQDMTGDISPIWHIVIDTTFQSTDIFIAECEKTRDRLNPIPSTSTVSDSSSSYIAVDGRSLLYNSSSQDIALGGQALAITSFHHLNKYHSSTGAHTLSIEAGAKRVCSKSRMKIYPRIDPVAIACVISFDGEKCLLGRSRRFNKNMFSCLSGFIEQAESVQEAVRREVWEEAGVRIDTVHIILSQPWPVGRSGSCELMLGCVARAVTDEIQVNTQEMEEVRWFTRPEATAMLEASLLSHTSTRGENELYTPSERAIAHHLVKEFVTSGPHYQHLMNGSFTPDINISMPVFKNIITAGISGLGLGIFLSLFLFRRLFI